jgi:phage terminase large subunit
MAATVITGSERWLDDEARRAVQNLTATGARPLLLPYFPFPKQSEFHASAKKYRLFGGAAGPGKTKALLMETIDQANRYSGVDTLLLRRTFPELESSLMQYFRRDIPPELYRSYHESKHVVTWWNGSTTRFGYCKTENEVYQYQGAEFLFIGIDELTLFTLKQWQFLTSRNRCPVPGAFPNMAGATNPGNIGHAWVKALWIDKKPAPGMERTEEYDPADYDFIAARVSDNPIYKEDPHYLKTLNALPQHLRQAFLEGDWNVFAGQYFDIFDVGRHTERAENIAFERWWPRWISIDWGFEHPAAVYWHAAARSTGIPACAPSPATAAGTESTLASPEAGYGSEENAPRQVVITYRELVQNRLAPRQLAREIIERSRDAHGQPERIEAIYLSPDAFSRRTNEASIAEQLGDVFAAAGLPRPAIADNDRVGGWMLMYQMLDAGEWLITQNCAELIRVLPALTRDETKIEDIAKRDGDDAADAARYGLKSSRWGSAGRPSRPPLEQRLAARVTSCDPTVRAIQARKALLDEQQRGAPVFLRRRPWWFRN